MLLDRRVLSLVQLLYDAAIDEALWPKALQGVAELTGSQAATFWTLESSGGPRLPVFATFNLDDRFVRDYLEHMVALDPTVKYLVAHPDKPIVHDGMVITEREKNSSAYYDWQRRESDVNFRMVGQSRTHRGSKRELRSIGAERREDTRHKISNYLPSYMPTLSARCSLPFDWAP